MQCRIHEPANECVADGARRRPAASMSMRVIVDRHHHRRARRRRRRFHRLGRSRCALAVVEPLTYDGSQRRSRLRTRGGAPQPRCGGAARYSDRSAGGHRRILVDAEWRIERAHHLHRRRPARVGLRRRPEARRSPIDSHLDVRHRPEPAKRDAASLRILRLPDLHQPHHRSPGTLRPEGS